MVGKRGIVPFDLARTFAGGVSEDRLHRLVDDGVLTRKEDGLDADQFFAALARQEEVRRRPPAPFRVERAVSTEDGASRLFKTFSPGFADYWAAGVSSDRLPGVDYDAAIRQAIIEGSGEYSEAAPAIEAAIWLRFGDPAAVRLEDLKQAARAIATGWPKIVVWRYPPDWRARSVRNPSTVGYYHSPRAALETALSMKHWTVYLGRSSLIDHATSDQILADLRFWADRTAHFNPRCDGVANGFTGVTIDLFDKAMAQIRKTAGQFFDFYVDVCGRATC